jgi:hypothetical protein
MGPPVYYIFLSGWSGVVMGMCPQGIACGHPPLPSPSVAVLFREILGSFGSLEAPRHAELHIDFRRGAGVNQIPLTGPAYTHKATSR